MDIHAPDRGDLTETAPRGAFLIPRPLAVDAYSQMGTRKAGSMSNPRWRREQTDFPSRSRRGATRHVLWYAGGRVECKRGGRCTRERLARRKAVSDARRKRKG